MAKVLAKDLLVGLIASFVLRSIAAGSSFLLWVVVARSLGAVESGLFFLGFTVVTLFATVGRFGLDNSLVRFVAAEQNQGNYVAVWGVYRKSMLWGLGCSLSVAVLILMLQFPLTIWIFQQDGFRDVLWVMVLGLPLVALYTLHAQALQGLRQVSKAISLINISVPFLLSLGVLIFSLNTAVEAAWLYVAVTAITFVLGYVWWRVCAPAIDRPPKFDSEELLASCRPLWAAMVLTQGILWFSPLLLGVWGKAEDVALFSAAHRTAMLTSFILLVVNAVVAPKFSAMHREGNLGGVRKLALTSTRLMLIAALPVFTIIMVFPEFLMGLFGKEFRDAGGVLRILAIGELVNIATGSVGYLLMMTGNERQMRTNVLVGAVVGVVAGVTLIPEFGVVGAAIATALAVASQNLLGMFHVRRLLGFNTLAFWKKI